MANNNQTSRDPKDIADKLTAPDFVSTETPHVATEPAEPTLMILPLDKIDFSLHNPRTTTNPKYDEIKESIINIGGLITMLTVTKTPGEDVYRLDAGGNTRLAAIKAAYKDTNDERLSTLTVLFNPYGGDTKILVNHLIENGMRSDNTFIEKAIAVQQTIDLLVKEKKIKSVDDLSDRQIIKLINDDYGYSIHRAAFIGYRYALNRLSETIPNALKSGIGRPAVERIQALEKTYQIYCENNNLAYEQFEIMFDMVLARCDNDSSFDFDLFENTLQDEISNHLGSSAENISEQIAAKSKTSGSDSPSKHLPDLVDDDPSYEQPHVDSFQESQTDDEPDEEIKSHQPVLDNINTSPIELSLIKREIYQSACDVAKPFGLKDLINATDQGFGFYIEYPGSRLDSEYQSACWWFFLHLSELLQQPDPLEWLPQDSLLGVLLKQFSTKGKEVLFEKFSATVGQSADTVEWMPCFLTHPEGEIRSISTLLGNIRQIRKIHSEVKEGE